jgi:hypothetical protein
MDPQRQFCHSLDGTANGEVEQGDISIHDCKAQRSRWLTCGGPFAAMAS